MHGQATKESCHPECEENVNCNIVDKKLMALFFLYKEEWLQPGKTNYPRKS